MMLVSDAASVSQDGDEEGGGGDGNDGKKDPIQGGPYTVLEEELKA
jgi:hypothetical protein